MYSSLIYSQFLSLCVYFANVSDSGGFSLLWSCCSPLVSSSWMHRFSSCLTLSICWCVWLLVACSSGVRSAIVFLAVSASFVVVSVSCVIYFYDIFCVVRYCYE